MTSAFPALTLYAVLMMSAARSPALMASHKIIPSSTVIILKAALVIARSLSSSVRFFSMRRLWQMGSVPNVI